jgi:hypothetical protein
MMESPLVKRLIWTGMLAGVGALSSAVSAKVAALVFKRIFHEDPPE